VGTPLAVSFGATTGCSPGGDKSGDDRWYARNVPLADRLYDDYLAGMDEVYDAKDDQVQ
jgi:hypothetical protein